MGQYNEDLRDALIALGYTGALNDMLVSMYRANGYTGSLNDMAKAARDATSSTELFPILP